MILMTTRTQNLLSAALFAILIGGGGALGCGKSAETGAEVTAENIEASEDVLPEGHDEGTVVWRIAPDGQVRALVKAPDGKPIEKDVSGTLIVPGASGEQRVALNYDTDQKLLVGAAPKLEADLTELRYEIKVSDKTWTGALHVPAGGTKALAEGSKKATAKVEVKGKTGPNGGVIQVVGDDTLEIIADKESGEVRVYVLGPDLKPIAIGERKVKLGLVGATAETVVLAPGPGSLYFVGKVNAKVDPVKVTVFVTHPDHVDVAVVGWAPGTVLVVGARAPTVKVLVAPAWRVDVKVRTPGVVVVGDDDDDDDDGIRVKFKGHGHGRGGAVIHF